jgi:hypothetical protein
VVTQPSRRAFLTGRRTPATPWGHFCARLSRTCVGSVTWDKEDQSTQAWLKPARAIDVMHAQVLCLELGVQLILLNSDAEPDPGRPILWVDSRAEWAQLELVDAEAGLWRADAGVTLWTLHQQGVGLFSDTFDATHAHQTLAQWFASPFDGRLTRSGIVQAEVLLADGTLEMLGPFGASGSRPLRSLSLQKKIPRLFELAQSPQAALCAQCESWPLRYRLDGLMPQSGDSPNLAWLFQGHGGSLAWLQTLWLQKPVSASMVTEPLPSVNDSVDLVSVGHSAAELDQSIKQTLDPTGVFGRMLPAKGLESNSFT